MSDDVDVTRDNAGSAAGQADIPHEVRRRISRFSGVPEPALKETHKLLGDLGMQHPSCVSLAGSLDKFVKGQNPNGEIRVSAIDDGGATVGSTTELVESEIRGQ